MYPEYQFYITKKGKTIFSIKTHFIERVRFKKSLYALLKDVMQDWGFG